MLGEPHLSIAKHICLRFYIGKRLQLVFIKPVLSNCKNVVAEIDHQVLRFFAVF